MIALRYVYVVALVLWVGGLMTIGGVVAPSAFAILDPASGAAPSSAASMVGEVLRRFHLIGYLAGTTLIGTLVLMKVVGPRPRGFAARLVIVGVMLATTLATGFWIDPEIASVRDSAGGPIGSLAADDHRRVRFGRLHAMSTALMAMTTIGGLALCYWETRE